MNSAAFCELIQEDNGHDGESKDQDHAWRFEDAWEMKLEPGGMCGKISEVLTFDATASCELPFRWRY
jgi:hypothetical protein